MDTSACSGAWPITFNCNPLTHPGASPVTITVGGTDYQGALYPSSGNPDDDNDSFCFPAALPTGVNNGNGISYLRKINGVCHRFSGKILIDGDEAVFCFVSFLGLEVTCPEDPGQTD